MLQPWETRLRYLMLATEQNPRILRHLHRQEVIPKLWGGLWNRCRVGAKASKVAKSFYRPASGRSGPHCSGNPAQQATTLRRHGLPISDVLALRSASPPREGCPIRGLLDNSRHGPCSREVLAYNGPGNACFRGFAAESPPRPPVFPSQLRDSSMQVTPCSAKVWGLSPRDPQHPATLSP